MAEPARKKQKTDEAKGEAYLDDELMSELASESVVW
jgi:hypothetical protein